VQFKSTTLRIHGSKLSLVPSCREHNTPFSVYESAEIFSTGVSNTTLGKAIVSSIEKSRDDVGSNSEGLDLDEFAKIFGERTIGGLDKRSGMVDVQARDGQFIVYPWFRDGRRGWAPGQILQLPLDTLPEELARICREQLNASFLQSTAAA
jgi:hypothetical protein